VAEVVVQVHLVRLLVVQVVVVQVVLEKRLDAVILQVL
tara:strand:+ start:42 stop:155 length:114 start_codon:yes stop_codon:yes gene_type:complete